MQTWFFSERNCISPVLGTYCYFLTDALFQTIPNIQAIKFAGEFKLTSLAIFGCSSLRLPDIAQVA
jgi:hypothetical protein